MQSSGDIPIQYYIGIALKFVITWRDQILSKTETTKGKKSAEERIAGRNGKELELTSASSVAAVTA